MAELTSFNNVIIGQFVLSGVPIKAYVGGRFLTITDADDVEDPLIGFGMDEDGAMHQFSYPEVEFLQVQGNKVDIMTYNQGMAKLAGGAAPEDDKEDKGEEDKEEEPKKEESVMPRLANLIEADSESIKKDIADKKKELIDLKKDLLDAETDEMEDAEDSDAAMDEGEVATPGTYTFGVGDIINNKNPGCVHYGSKGIVIQIPKQGLIRYTVTNTGDTYKPGDILTKTADQLEKI
jgi:hypothetical protein